MKKNFKYFAFLWFVFLVVFNTVVFLVRPVVPEVTIEYDSRFWVAWVFILIAFAGNFICAYYAFKAENLKKMFYSLSLIMVSWTALIVMLVTATVLILIPDCPVWIAAIVCILVTAFDVIAVMKAQWATKAVNNVDIMIKTQASFIKNLIIEAEGICTKAQSDEAKSICQKVFEAVRYSDPMSTETVSGLEEQLTAKMRAFSDAVVSNDEEKVRTISFEIVSLVEERNRKCIQCK